MATTMSAMATCATCQHWERLGEDNGLRRIMAADFPALPVFGYCYHPLAGDSSYSHLAANSLFGSTAGEGVAIVTGPEFGCVLHEVKR